MAIGKHGRLFENLGSKALRGAGQSDAIGKRLDRPRPRIEQSAVKPRSPRARSGFLFGQKSDGISQRDPLAIAGLEIGKPFGAMGEVKRAFAHGLAGNRVFFDGAEDPIRRGGKCTEQMVACLVPQSRDDILGREPQPRIGKPHVAPRSAKADRGTL